MINKTIGSAAEAVAGLPDGATVLIGGFGAAGQPVELIDALLNHDAEDLTVVSNNAGNGTTGLAALIWARLPENRAQLRPHHGRRGSCGGCPGANRRRAGRAGSRGRGNAGNLH